MDVSRDSSPEMFAQARRTLAYLLAISGDPKNAEEAMKLLPGGGAIGSDPAGILDRRVRAQLLAIQHGSANRREALRIVEDLIAQKQGTPDDFLLAGQLHEILGDWPMARQRFLPLLEARSGTTAVHLAVAARSLLRHREIDSAQEALRQLQKSQPDSWPTREIASRVLRAQGKAPEARSKVQEYARSPGADMLAAAALLNEFGDYAAAEELLRELAADPSRPIGTPALIGFLVERRRFNEALELCDRAWEKGPSSSIAEAYVRILASMGGDMSAIPRIESRLQAAMAKHPDQLEYIVAMATMRSLQGRNQDALPLYRRVVDKDPANVAALNNLAWLMALGGGPATEAEVLASEAVKLSGGNPGMVDTLAIARLAIGKDEKTALAIQDLESITTEYKTPSTLFHLAQAYWQGHRPREAALAWRRAKELGLTKNHLHVLEHANYERLSKELN
jgi:tetratricopeptide (TPR) repeat protein